MSEATVGKQELPKLSRRDFLKDMAVVTLGGIANIGPRNFFESLKLVDLLDLRQPVKTPASLMLHSASGTDESSFKDLAKALAKNYNPLTYRGLYQTLLDGTLPSGKPPILLSIDDLGTDYLNPNFEKMINILEGQGLYGTLGIVTRGSPNDEKPEISKYLRRCAKEWEIAIHTEGHHSLPRDSDEQLKFQIEQSYNDISRGVGVVPSTLILPYGNINQPGTTEQDQRIFEVCKDLDIPWIVGIAGGKSFRGRPPYYVGRIGPAGNDVEKTLAYLRSSFFIPPLEANRRLLRQPKNPSSPV